MMPLSFKEYLSAFDENRNTRTALSKLYSQQLVSLRIGVDRTKDIRQYLDGIYNSIIVKDIITRRRIGDVEMLKSVARFLF